MRSLCWCHIPVHIVELVMTQSSIIAQWPLAVLKHRFCPKSTDHPDENRCVQILGHPEMQEIMTHSHTKFGDFKFAKLPSSQEKPFKNL